MARASWDGFFVWVSNVNANPRLVEGVFGWDAGGLESIIEDSSSFWVQEVGDLVGICASKPHLPGNIEDSPLARIE